MEKVLKVLFALSCAALAGCQTTPLEREALVKQVPSDYRQRIAEYLRQTLKDPYTVRDAEISQPLTVFVGLVNGGHAPGACVRMNAKNSFGAYIGIQTSEVGFLKNGSIWVTEPIFDTCNDAVYSRFSEIENIK